MALEGLEARDLPAPLTWSAGISLPSARAGLDAIVETDNSILVLGGNTSRVYQLAANDTAWTTANSIDTSRVSGGVGSTGGSHLLVYGGAGDDSSLATASYYDPTDASYIGAAASMSTGRSLFAYATDGSNRDYAIGGTSGGTHRLATVERFDPATGTWSSVASLPQALSGATAVYDQNGHIFVFGGATSSASATTTALRYTVATDKWDTVASLPTATTEAAAVLGADGNIYLLGGKDTNGAAQATVQAYSITGNSWSTATSLPSAVSDEAAVSDSGGRIVVLGGKNSSGTAVSTVSVTQSLGTSSIAPVIAQPANTTTMAGLPFTDAINAFGLPTPTFSLTAAPSGMTIDSSTGVISWTPPLSLRGAQTVTVQATNASGTDTKSFTVTVGPDTIPPTTPTNLAVGTITTTSLALSWTASTDPIGVSGYRLFAYTPPQGHSGRGGGITTPAKYTLLVDNISTNSYTVTGLTPGAGYSYAVAAFDAAGNQSAYSNVLNAQTWLAPSLTWSTNGVNTDPAVSVVANHSLYLTLWASGNPAPTVSAVSLPGGAVYTAGSISWTPTANQVGVNYVTMETSNAVGTTDTVIPITVIADVPIPSLSVNGGYTYTLGNMTADPTNPFTYSLNLVGAFSGGSSSCPQYGLSGTPFSFQFTGTSNTNPTTYTLVSGPSGITIDPNSGVGTWTPGKADAGNTTVTVSAANSAGTSYLTFNFPTYFTGAPTNVAVVFYSNASNTAPSALTPVVTWTAPADTTGIADYKVTVTDAHTLAVTTYDTQSTATSFTLTGVSPTQNWVNVTAYDANGNPSITSTTNVPLYLYALSQISWTFSTPNIVAGAPLSVQFSPSGSYSYLTYAIASGPAGVTINPTTGLLSWTPGLADVGTANVVVSATSGWGTEYLTLSFPVYFTDAPTAVSVLSSTDANGGTTWTASWTSPTMNTSSITGYQITFIDASAPANTPPTIFTFTADNLSVVLSNVATLDGSVQVAALDAAGDLGVASPWFTF